MMKKKAKKKAKAIVKEKTPPTKRELEVLQLIADGLTDEQIAHELKFGIENAHAFRKKLLEKFEVNNVALLIATAFRKGLVK